MTVLPSDPASPVASAPDLPRLAWAALLAQRDARWHRRPDLRVLSEEAAHLFVDEVGMAFLFSNQGIVMPSLWEAINGGQRPMPEHHHDPALGWTWDWKDSLPARKAIWYGKLLRQKPTLLSLRLLPAFYALSSNFGELDDYLEQYQDGRMSVEARDVYAAILKNGPSSTNALRRLTGMVGTGEVARRFDRAIGELQADLKIVKTGIGDDNRWKYTYIYDALLRWSPELAEQARALTGRQAMTAILTAYLRTVVALPAPSLAPLFGWDAAVTARVLAELRAAGTLTEVLVLDVPAPARGRVGSKRATEPGDEVWVGLGSS